MLTDLDDALRAGGIEFWASPGWQKRGHGPMGAPIRGILVHHTAGGGPRDWLTVQNGRPGLAGPLAHMTLERDGSVRLIAAGMSYHAGNGTHPLVGTNNGNLRMIGIEGVSPGVGASAWTAAQRAGYPRLVAALCRWYRLPAAAGIFHKEWARPVGRKIDAGQWNPDDFRIEIVRHLTLTTLPEEDPVQNYPIDGQGRMVRLCPVGSASADRRQAWLSASLPSGTGSIRVFAQGDTAGVHDWTWGEGDLTPAKDGLVRRPVKELKDGVTKLVISWDLRKAPEGGVLCLETRPRA
ncbi:MAG: N-acetylmuramoyl-L-alanine amidase [Pseudonocardiaceae bacterium]